MAKTTSRTTKKDGAPQGAPTGDTGTDVKGATGALDATGTGTPPQDDAAAQAAAQAAAEALAKSQAAAQAAQDEADAAAARAKAEEEAAADAKREQVQAEAAARAALEAEADAAAKAAALTFPRDMLVVNETARDWVVRKHAPASSSVQINVRDEDDLHRLRENCRAVLLISDHYKPVEGQPHALRIVEIDGEQA